MNHADAEKAGGAGGYALPKGLIAYFAANPVAANMLMVFLIVAGAIAGFQLSVQTWPELESRRIVVTVESPGASPEEVQEDINRRIEEAVIGIEGIRRVVSSARENFGRLDIEIETFADSDQVLGNVKNVVNAIENFPSATTYEPEIELFRSKSSVMTLSVSSELSTEKELRLAAENLRDQLLGLPSVSHVLLVGARDREISIELSEEALRRHKLDIRDVSKAIRAASLNLTPGEFRTDSGSIVLSIAGKRYTGDEFKDIPLFARLDGTVLTLNDVATIRDDFADGRVIADLDGARAIFVKVSASREQSIEHIRKVVLSHLETYAPPKDVSVNVWSDHAETTATRINGVIDNALFGAILVFLVLVAVFDLRIAFWTTFGIPLAFVGSLAFFAPADLTLNLGTLFAFFLMIGIVVDDAVVVGESIVSERKKGLSALAAAVAGTRAVYGPLAVGAITTIIALIPFVFIREGDWQVVSVIPYVAAFVLAVSLVEALLILPAHLSHEKPWSFSPLREIQLSAKNWLDSIRDSVVSSTVSWSVRHVWVSIPGSILLVVVGVLLLRFDFVSVVFGGNRVGVANEIQVEISLPAGSPFESTVAVAERFRRAAQSINSELEGTSIKSLSVVAGSILSTRNDQNDKYGENLATVVARLYSEPVRKAGWREVEQAWRRNVGDTSVAEHVEFVNGRLKIGPNLAYSLRHDDRDVLNDAARELMSALSSTRGVYDIFDNISLGKRKLEIELTRSGTVAGLSPAALGAQLRARLHGSEVQRIQRGHDELKVVVNYPPENRRSLSELARIRIDRPGGGQVQLSEVATLTEKQELAELTRIDGIPAVIVEAKADEAVVTPNRARRQIRDGVIQELRSKYPGIIIEEEGISRNEKATIDTLIILVPLALLASYVVMAGFLRSYWKPVAAAAGIPAVFVGAVLIHWILGWDFSLISIFGILAASGVVINDGVILLDRYNKICLEMPTIPAIAAASAATRQRFRAVLLTSLTTILGLSPLLYERSEALLFLVPFAASMIGGLVLSGMFVLFVLPALILVIDGRRE